MSTLNGSSRHVNMQHAATDDNNPTIPLDVSGLSSSEIDDMLHRYARQRVAIAAYGAKTHAAVEQLRELHHHGAITLDQTFNFINAITMNGDFEGPLQRMHHETMVRMLQTEIEWVYQILGRGSANIKAEVARTLDRYSFGKGGGFGLYANVNLGAKIGITRDQPQGDTIDVRPTQRFDGFVVGETGSGDEFEEL